MSPLVYMGRVSTRLLILLALVLPALLMPGATAAHGGSNAPTIVYFPITGHHVSDEFLSTWRGLGGLATFGYPLSEPMTDPDTGMTVQYFERERFEYHPENAGTEYEVEFARLGSWLAEGRPEPAFTRLPADTPQANTPDRTFFPESGHYLSNGFRAYRETHGGLRIFGYPISEELQENGLAVQYFERARFEWHPENAGTPWEIELGRLGADRAVALGIDTAPIERQEGAPDYDESLWAPPPAEPRSISIPVLMYHRFEDNAERYQTPIWKFEQQLDWLQVNGYHAITITELYDYIVGIGSLPENPIALTFDDSPASQWSAVQALNAREMRGTFFVLTGQAGLENWQL